jgi:DNA-3-methyladenine glycosylase II
LDKAVDALRVLDLSTVTALLAAGGPPLLRHRAPGFEGLAWIVVSQQVSTASARAIFNRLKTTLGAIEAPAVAAMSDPDLRANGLSTPKCRTLRAIAAAIESGHLDFSALAGCPADDARAALVAIHGVGPWTADIFLLFCLGHPDAWPAGDLALREAARVILDLPDRPDEKTLRVIGERWRPWRGAAAYLLWSAYNARRSPATAVAP